MSKTLIVSYLPRGERSNTKKVLDGFTSAAQGKTTIETLDLIEDTPELLLRDNLMAYIMREYVGEKKPEYDTILAHADTYITQLKSADNVILAFPMYNFSFPAVVKAWFDLVMLKNHTWDMNESGFIGLLKNKRALIITTSGGDYSAMPSYEHALSLGQVELGFMGISDITTVTAAGINAKPNEADDIVAAAVGKAADVAKKWFA